MKKIIDPEWGKEDTGKMILPWCSLGCEYRDVVCGICNLTGYDVHHDTAGICWPAVNDMRKKYSKLIKGEKK